jgi:hypothetical protein
MYTARAGWSSRTKCDRPPMAQSSRSLVKNNGNLRMSRSGAQQFGLQAIELDLRDRPPDKKAMKAIQL